MLLYSCQSLWKADRTYSFDMAMFDASTSLLSGLRATIPFFVYTAAECVPLKH
jgi:hypothetical protein